MSQQWVSVDNSTLLDREEAGALARARGAAKGLQQRLDEAPKVLTSMRSAAAGQPKAADPSREPSSEPPWCFDHEQTVPECHKAGFSCLGENIERATDTTGETATQPDPASARRRRYLATLALVPKIEAELYRLARNDATDAKEREALPDAPGGPGDGWCVSCYRFERTYWPIAMHRDGRRRYNEYCRFCGDFHAIVPEGCTSGIEPSMAMLEAHLTPGMVVTDAMVTEARNAQLKAERTRARHQRRTTLRQAAAVKSGGGPA